MVKASRVSEDQLESKLNLTHAARRTRRGIRLKTVDLARACTINALAGSTLVRVETQDRVVEEIKDIRPELHLYPLGNGEVLRDRSIVSERPGSTEAENSDVPQIADPRITKRSGQGGQRSEVSDSVIDGIELPRTDVKCS